jgi:hypothetical protein
VKLGRVVGFLIVLLLCGGGIALYEASVRSDNALVNESNNYQPVCNGEHMRPGDTCLRFGKGAVSQTYTEMVADHTPAKLAHTYANRRAFGEWLIAIGGVLGALIVLGIVLSARKARIARAKAVAAG